MPIVSAGEDQLILAARLYFVDGLSQAQVAKLVNVSQAKVSRMLAEARERGLVRITVAEYEPRELTVELQLREALGVDATVIRAVPDLGIKDLRQLVGYFAAPYILARLRGAHVVALSGGRTIQAVVEHLKIPVPLPTLQLVQAMGTIDSSPGPYDAVELGRALAARATCAFERLNAPALLPDANICGRLIRSEQIRHVLSRLAAADLAMVGVGTLDNSIFVERGVLGAKDIATLKRSAAVGEILGRFYDAAGKECPTPYQHRVVGLGLDELKKIARRIAVVAGGDRTAAIQAAIRGGLINEIVLDEPAAKQLLSSSLGPQPPQS